MALCFAALTARQRANTDEWWPNISREFWRLHDRGENWAEATEGSPSVWARERYDWARNSVVGTTQESNVWQPGGTWALTAEPRG